MKTTIVSAADEGYFNLLKGLILSLKSYPVSREVPVTVLDIGLSEDSRKWLLQYNIHIINIQEETSNPEVDGQKQLHISQRLRPHLPTKVPGYDLYLWMDADLWLQDHNAVHHLLASAQQGAIAIIPEVHVAYHSLYDPRELTARLKTYTQFFDQQTAWRLARNPTINSGLFALRADSPLWNLWAETLDSILKKNNYYYAEQQALNYVIYSENIPRVFLPAWCNWITHQAPPVLNAQTGKLCEPNPPFQQISIMHLTVNAKKGPADIRVVGSSEQHVKHMSLAYNEGLY